MFGNSVCVTLYNYICNKHNLSDNFLVLHVSDKVLVIVRAAGMAFVSRSQGLFRAGQSFPDGSETDSLQDTAELGTGVCGVSGRIYVRHDKKHCAAGKRTKCGKQSC